MEHKRCPYDCDCCGQAPCGNCKEDVTNKNQDICGKLASLVPSIQNRNSISRVKKMVDDIPTAVDDALKGLAMANKGLVLLEGYRIIMRRDHAQLKFKVKLLGGNHAGHEPAYAGFIGPGMLTAAVVGDVYNTPASLTILHAIHELSRNNTAGILLIISNYMNNRLNFGIAMERARNEGISVKMLVVGEDCAIPVTEVEGRRGLAGIVLIHKLAGAMAEEGRSLEDIFAACRSTSMTDMATITVGVKLATLHPELTKCNLLLGYGELELGLGIRGESGVHTIPFSSAADVVHIMLEHMVNPVSKTHFYLEHCCPIVVLINNRGGSSKMEEQIFVFQVLKQLADRGYKVERSYHGTFISSLDTSGFSITLLKVNTPEILTYLDSPTSATAWPRTLCAASVNMEHLESFPISVPSMCPPEEEEKGKVLRQQIGPKISDKSTLCVNQVIRFATDALVSCEYQLNQFDSEAGDGDSGTVLKKGALALKQALLTGTVLVSRPFAMLEDMSALLEASMGSTSGALYTVFLAAAAKPFGMKTEEDPVDAYMWLEALQSGIQALSRYSRAKVGDKTMLDALHAASVALEKGLNEDPSNPVAALRLAAEAAEAAARECCHNRPKCARGGSKVKDTPLLMPDPGAHAVGIWMRALYEGCRLLF